MSYKVGELYADLGVHDSEYNSKLDKAEGKLGKTGGFLMSKGAMIAGAMGLSFGAIGSKALDTALNLETMGKKAEIVFGKELDTVKAWSKANAAAMGLTTAAATGLAANFADLLIPMGYTRDKAAEMSTSVVGLSGALAEWSGGTRSAAEVSQILAKAMLGERESLKELGISITEADVSTRLLAMGKAGLTGQSLEQAKAEATQQLIFEKSKDAQTAFANSTDDLASRKANLTAKVKEVWESIVTKLIPVLSSAMGWVSDKVGPAIAWLGDTFKGLGGIVSALKPIFEIAWGAIQKVVQIAEPLIKGALWVIQQAIEAITKAIDALKSAWNFFTNADAKATIKVQGAAADKRIAEMAAKGYTFNMGLPGYALGGTVPGPIGAPQLAVVHGGETINPPGQSSGNVYHIGNITIPNLSSPDVETLLQSIRAAARLQGATA